MKKYFVYMEDRDYVFKAAIPAESEKKAREYVQGNGEVITVKDVTNDFPIDADKVAQALKAYGFGEHETDFVVRALREINIAE